MTYIKPELWREHTVAPLSTPDLITVASSYAGMPIRIAVQEAPDDAGTWRTYCLAYTALPQCLLLAYIIDRDGRAKTLHYVLEAGKFSLSPLEEADLAPSAEGCLTLKELQAAYQAASDHLVGLLDSYHECLPDIHPSTDVAQRILDNRS